MSTLPLGLLYFAFPMVCILAIPADSRPGALPARIVFGIALYQLLVLTLGLVLGLTGHLSVALYVAVFACLTLLLGLLGVRNGLRLPLSGVGRWVRTRRGAAALVLIGVASFALLLELGADICFGTLHGDGLWYHIPRAMFWAGQGSFDPWPTPVAASLGLPVGADVILLHKIFLGLGWSGAGYVTLVLAVGAGTCIYLAGIELGLRCWHAVVAALLFTSFPAVGLRIWTVNSDLAAAFPALAAFVALYRLRSPSTALAVFVLLNGMAIACKPTVIPPAALLAVVALWCCRHKIAALRRAVLPASAALLGVVLVLASYWPVYVAFGDFLGGDYSRAHRASSFLEFLQGVAMHSGYWLLEPLGYFSRFREGWEVENLKSFYNALGGQFVNLPEMWKPYPGQDTGYTGLATVLALPVLFAGLSTQARILGLAVFLLGYLPLAGMIHPQPYFTRYNVLLLAGVALLWGGSLVFARGKWRWLLLAVVAVNLCALLVVVAINFHLQRTKWSQSGGLYHYVSNEDRATMAADLAGRSLLVLTESSERSASLDALLTGPRIAFPLRYVICPADGDWLGEFRSVANSSPWLALVHNGQQTLIAGPSFEHPSRPICAAVAVPVLEEALNRSGWSRFRQGRFVDLWRYSQ